MKAMNKNPSDRYRSADALRDDLKRVIEGMPVKVMGSVVPADVPEQADLTRTIAAKPTGGAPRPKKKPKKGLIIGIIVAALILLMGGGALAYTLLATPKVVVPNLKGKTLSQAQRAVEAAGLKLKVEKETYNEKIAPGHVISQQPDAGEKTAKGGTVNIVMSRGLQTVTTPNLSGKTIDEAEDILKKAGLGLGKVDEGFSDTVDVDKIMTQSPKAGAKIEKGATVDVTVSKGAESVEVPDVVNDTVDAGTSILQDAGFKVSRFDDYSETVDKDHIIKQSPISGDKSKKGSTITITVSKGSSKVALINLKGMKQSDAAAWLTSNELLSSVTTAAGPPGTVSGNVWDMNPTNGVVVNRGSTVSLWVQP